MLKYFSQLFIGHSPRYLKPDVAMGPAGILAECITCSQKNLNTLRPDPKYELCVCVDKGNTGFRRFKLEE